MLIIPQITEGSIAGCQNSDINMGSQISHLQKHYTIGPPIFVWIITDRTADYSCAL